MLVHAMLYSQANFIYSSSDRSPSCFREWQIFRPFDVCLFTHMLCSSVLLVHVDTRVYCNNRLKAKFNERHINKWSIAVWGVSRVNQRDRSVLYLSLTAYVNALILYIYTHYTIIKQLLNFCRKCVFYDFLMVLS